MNETTRAPLRRSPSSRVLAGVCGGLGEFFGNQPNLVPLGVPRGLHPRRRARFGHVPLVLDHHSWRVTHSAGSV